MSASGAANSRGPSGPTFTKGYGSGMVSLGSAKVRPSSTAEIAPPEVMDSLFALSQPPLGNAYERGCDRLCCCLAVSLFTLHTAAICFAIQSLF